MIDPAWYEKIGARAAKDGTLPYFRYVVREKGKVELGTISCAMCHTRVMPDGTVVKGAQGNLPFERAAVYAVQDFPGNGPDFLSVPFSARPGSNPTPWRGWIKCLLLRLPNGTRRFRPA